ncbi:uncharacterized protein CIMG_11324 [Coccidioides immitis RS]|uniref:Uncharacterized protein n=3 Tax=Coccidioides immitis TaxID=5501 RepID=A0A0D8JUG2_COCIM|nr:uncharacterized protein CIMG_11324 [Coccidioides immitis RS]KJF60985.1 hypothetical protein CIMG_11324 [Coccidioides immitis RS]KMP04598.1 hypothetical protein CIRG_04279 [Coccidioides immitis RMSCC 2394]KMU90404.1 hypothetical protein CIHG_08214 [Coccidioides immitis H538.4]
MLFVSRVKAAPVSGCEKPLVTVRFKNSAAMGKQNEDMEDVSGGGWERSPDLKLEPSLLLGLKMIQPEMASRPKSNIGQLTPNSAELKSRRSVLQSSLRDEPLLGK